MKKITTIICAALSINAALAQVSVTEDNDIKNFRFGLKGDLSVDWMSPDNDRKYLSNGVGVGYDWGMQMEFALNKTTSVVTGLSLKSNTLKLDYHQASSADEVIYVLDNDEEFVDLGTATTIDTSVFNSPNSGFKLLSRTISANYVNIPLALKMKTKEIGYLTYYGQFGANIGINTRARATDVVNNVSSFVDSTNTLTFASGELTKEKLDVTKGVQPVRAGIQIGFGGEYNFSGNTSLLFGVFYNHYFTNALRRESRESFLRYYDAIDAEWQNAGAKAIPGSVSLTVGILF